MWDERRSVVLTKPRPSGKAGLRGPIGAHRSGLKKEGAIEWRLPAYRLVQPKRTTELAEVTWADWDHRGRLLVATQDARLQVRDVDSPALTVLCEHVITALPSSGPAPEWARRW